jgi:thioredoxin reductase
MTRLHEFTIEDDQFIGIDAAKKKYTSTSAVVATSRIPKRLSIPNANLKGVHFCSMCDGPLYLRLFFENRPNIENLLFMQFIISQLNLPTY